MRVEDFSLPREVPTEAKEMLDNIRRILNNGGYVPQVISAIPAWTGDDGEWVIYVNGAELRNYVYNATNATWEYGLPITSKYGWGYVTVTTVDSSAITAVSFGYTFRAAPIVITNFVGYTTAGATAISDFATGITKVCYSPYAITTTGYTQAIYSGDGSAFPCACTMGFSWLAIG